MEVEIKQDLLQEDKDEMHEREEEEKKAEENPSESGEEKKNLKPIDRIVQYIAESGKDTQLALCIDGHTI